MRTTFLYFILFLLLISCTRLPDAQFYEVDGIVSIEASSLPDDSGWENKPFKTSVSKVSRHQIDISGSLTFPFYVRQPGRYFIWVLAADSEDDHTERSLPIRVINDEGFLLENFQISMNGIKQLTWQNRDVETGTVMAVEFKEPGHYRVLFESGGQSGFAVDKLHLTLNNAREPSGFGFPETARPGIDPVLAKRDHRVGIPPAWLFLPICGTTDHSPSEIYSVEAGFVMDDIGCISINPDPLDIDKNLLQDPEQLQDMFYEISDHLPYSNGRGLIFAPLQHLQIPDFKRFPTRWSHELDADFREQIEMTINPRRSTYEVPFLVNSLPDMLKPGSVQFTEEMLIRWLQFSVFNTVMYMPLDNPDSLRDIISESGATQMNALFQLRHQLFPYVYSLAHLIRSTGVKPVRGNASHQAQFRLGNAFLVAPIYEPGTEQRTVYLPEGLWYHFMDGAEYEGGQTWFIESPINSFPVFVKAGSIIPYRMNGKVSTAIFDELILEIYTGGTGTFRLYEDDGLTNNYLQGEFTTTAFRYFEHTDYATFTIGRQFRHIEGQPDEKQLILKFKYINEPESISAEDISLERGEGENMWEYNSDSRTLTVNWLQRVHQKTDFYIQF